MFIVTVKNIDVDSLALPTLYGKTTLQNYNFFMSPQGAWLIFLFFLFFVGRGSHRLPHGGYRPFGTWAAARGFADAGWRGLKSPDETLSPLQGLDGPSYPAPTRNGNTCDPCRHDGQGSAIS
ncbi:MAG: hypothetical protein IJ622_01020 [Bacteroidales bacterium]|nr:hypothetical protein [Bacteroidales bacterium]